MADDVDVDPLKSFSVWGSNPTATFEVRCRNRYGNVAYFQDYAEGVVLIGFGTDEGFEPSKDAFLIDKKNLPQIIQFLQQCQGGGHQA